MIHSHFIALISAPLAAGLLLAGCGHKEGGGHEHGVEHAGGKDGHDHGHEHGVERAGGKDGHGHEEESPSGASFKAGEGITLTGETRKILGLEIADVAERRLPNQIRFTVHVFGEKHRHALTESDHAGCDVHGSALLPAAAAAAVKSGLPVDVLKNTNSPLGGVVLAVQKALALGESEIVIGVSNATAEIAPGEFVPARINLPRDDAVMAIPQTALLRTSEGAFVYAVNGDAYFRKPVKAGVEADGWVEIIDGLLAGDRVVTQPVQTLWLIELRATKGGGHAH